MSSLSLALAAAVSTATPLSFADLFEARAELHPSARALALDGKRVRIEGYMARTDEPLRGAFWLCKRPVMNDEEGDGSADLPIESILVVLSPRTREPVPTIERALSVEGVFRVGRQVDKDGTVSSFRIILDPAPARGRTVPKFVPKEKKQ